MQEAEKLVEMEVERGIRRGIELVRRSERRIIIGNRSKRGQKKKILKNNSAILAAFLFIVCIFCMNVLSLSLSL